MNWDCKFVVLEHFIYTFMISIIHAVSYIWFFVQKHLIKTIIYYWNTNFQTYHLGGSITSNWVVFVVLKHTFIKRVIQLSLKLLKHTILKRNVSVLMKTCVLEVPCFKMKFSNSINPISIQLNYPFWLTCYSYVLLFMWNGNQIQTSNTRFRIDRNTRFQN